MAQERHNGHSRQLCGLSRIADPRDSVDDQVPEDLIEKRECVSESLLEARGFDQYFEVFAAHFHVVLPVRLVDGILEAKCLKLLVAEALEAAAWLHPWILLNELIVEVSICFELWSVSLIDQAAVDRREDPCDPNWLRSQEEDEIEAEEEDQNNDTVRK